MQLIHISHTSKTIISDETQVSDTEDKTETSHEHLKSKSSF